ncbi:MAG: hypothetical protein NZ740_09840 [Kiritimatiellae bacterium]|nr:hypothetical protein [Kiritimatiellia bacterium]MDW8459394.1 hypothetical protein [Verrucomicrobiota bacterium]
MTENSSSSRPRVAIAIVSIDSAVGGRFIDTVCGGKGNEFVAEDRIIELRLIHYRPEEEGALIRQVLDCDAAALLVNHIDAISLENLKGAYRMLPAESALPLSILIVRAQGQMEFKMSCPACGQKLWVRDVDSGRKGRCPHCRKTFVLPSQTAHLKSTLMTPEMVPLITVTEGHVSKCQGPISELAARACLQAQVLKSSTLRVQVEDSEPSSS